MSRPLLWSNGRAYFLAYILGSLANGLLLFERSVLASRAGLQVDIVQLVLVQQLLMVVLVLSVAFSGTIRAGWRWFYAITSTLFVGFVGWRLASTFVAALELVGPLESKRIPVSDYEGSFYVLALTSTISYVLMILVLRRSYGRLASTRTVEVERARS